MAVSRHDGRWRGAWLAPLLALFLWGCASAGAAPDGIFQAVPPAGADLDSAGSARVESPLVRGWRFHLGQPAVGDPARPGFDDARWQVVGVPHTWNALGEYRLARTAATRNVQGIGWYRRELDAAALPPRSRHWLQFDAVGNVADVWVNGIHVGRHAGAFSRFRFDITAALRPGRNVIAVRADNSARAPGSSTAQVIPLLGDFFIHGGLYRDVALVSVGDAHIALDDFGGPGVYASTRVQDSGAAQIDITVRLTQAGGAAPAHVWLTLHDAQGAMVADATSPVQLVPGRTEAALSLRLGSPRRWDGRRDPYLYRLVARLVQGGTVVDRVEQRIGIRTFRVDPGRGFFLNGRHLPLRGVSRHQDRLGRGWALTPADHAQDMALIAEMGANSVRFAHYQHAREWFALSDAHGMVVWAELALVNKVAFGDAPASATLAENAKTQLIEQIRQHYNNPSVAVWGIGNEVDIDLAFNRLGPRADARPLLRELHALARREDPSRPTVVADCCEDTPGDKAPYLPVLAGISDLMGYNRYYGWYYGRPQDLGPHLDALHAKHPDIPISVSEYGAGAALTQHSDDPQGGPVDAGGRPHPEEFQAWLHEQTWPQIAARDYLWGSWIWNMFDFSSTVRQEGDATDINDKGLVSFDREVRKDAFFYFKAQWSDTPVVHVAGRRHASRPYPVVDVKAYSNAPRVALLVNGRELGERECPRRICRFPGVRLQPGGNQVVARALFAGRPVEDAVAWRAPDARDGLAINAGDLAGARVGTRRYGSDAFFAGGEGFRLAPATARSIAGRDDAALLGGYRRGAFAYRLPLPAGRWRIAVTSMSPEPDAPRAAFTVQVDGARPRAVMPGAVGSPRVEVFEAVAGDDGLHLRFGADALVSAIDARAVR